MTDKHTNTSKQAELHLQLQDLLAGYVDNALDEQQQAMVDAHLIACTECRADVERQLVLKQRLHDIPLTTMPEHVHKSIDNTLMSPAIDANGKKRVWIQNLLYQLDKLIAKPAIAISGWGIAITLGIIMVLETSTQTSNAIPMVNDVITEYRALNRTTLPLVNADPQSTPPAQWSDANTLGSWITSVGGAPATAFAMRSGNYVIIQYLIDEHVFFRNTNVRQDVADTGHYLFKNNDVEVLAMPLNNAGILVVGPKGHVPSPEQLVLNQI